MVPPWPSRNGSAYITALSTEVASILEPYVDPRDRGDDLVHALLDAPGTGTRCEPVDASPAPIGILRAKRPNAHRSVDAVAVGKYLEAGRSCVSGWSSPLAVLRRAGTLPGRVGRGAGERDPAPSLVSAGSRPPIG
ncbi:MAG TPA: hypothetical protein VMG36_03130 [Thermoplasmata archaeon]|nr:hypothetical protein [Thermoplasmata archaeon]